MTFKDYSLISNEWIDGKIKRLQESIEVIKKEEQTDENVLLLRLSSIKLRTLEYIKRNVLIPSEELTKDLYSEEDLREAFKQSRQSYIFQKGTPPVWESYEQWLEQYKNK